jgi:hypothetical protein
MAEYTYTVTQRVNYWGGVEADSPKEVMALFERGEWDDRKNTVESDRVQVYDEAGLLVHDTDPGPCETCGRNENAGFVNGEPRCHRHQ